MTRTCFLPKRSTLQVVRPPSNYRRLINYKLSLSVKSNGNHRSEINKFKKCFNQTHAWMFNYQTALSKWLSCLLKGNVNHSFKVVLKVRNILNNLKSKLASKLLSRLLSKLLSKCETCRCFIKLIWKLIRLCVFSFLLLSIAELTKIWFQYYLTFRA
jgi:hypothetical protein